MKINRKWCEKQKRKKNEEWKNVGGKWKWKENKDINEKKEIKSRKEKKRKDKWKNE